MQQTNFRFEAIVHDDASTDGTAAIIRDFAAKYPNIIKPIYEAENQYSKHDGSLQRIMNEACTGKYMAFCEGDDFWTDPLKLQKQVDYMEAHPECGMTYTDFSIKDERNEKEYISLFHTNPEKYPYDCSLDEWIIKPGYVAPMTWLIRKTDYEALVDNYKIESLDGTFVDFTYYLARCHPYCLLGDNTATYRIISESATQSKSFKKIYARSKNIYETQLKLADMYFDEGLSAQVKYKIKKNFYDNLLHYVVMANDCELLKEARSFYSRNESNLKVKLLLFMSNFAFLRNVLFSSFKMLRKAVGRPLC